MDARHYRWTWRFDVTPDRLWPFVADVDRFDRDIGLPAVIAAPGNGPDDPVIVSRAKGGHEYVQQPYEWLAPERFAVSATFPKGPLAALVCRCTLTPVGRTQTEVVYEVEATPRTNLSRWLIDLQFGKVLAKRIDTAYRRYATLAVGMSADAASAARAISSGGNVHWADGGFARLQTLSRGLTNFGVDEGLVERFVEYLATADDLAVGRIRPYELAAAWGLPRPQVLELFLQATRVGILELRWDILCPLCQGAKSSARSLAQLEGEVHCDTCNVDYRANFATSVEVTFRPAPTIRTVETVTYCFGGPLATPHVLAQHKIEPGTTVAVPIDLEPGRYRLRIPRLAGYQLLQIEPGAEPRVRVAVTSSWSDRELHLAPGGEIEFTNAHEQARFLRIERMGWSEHALIAADVLSQQRWRELFAGESLPPGQPVSVGELTVVFTHLRDASGLYRSRGDEAALARVLDHVGVLADAVDLHGGAVVKTMGDATMLAFRAPADAFLALEAIQARLDRRARETGRDPLVLKSGVATGPVLAVTMNDRLDYVGDTVNTAARLARVSNGADVVFAPSTMADPAVRDLLRANSTTTVVTRLRSGDDEAYRLAARELTPTTPDAEVVRRETLRGGPSAASPVPA